MNTLKKIFTVLIMITGICFLLYPSLSDKWNSMHQSKAIVMYKERVEDKGNSKNELMLEKAREYNKKLMKMENLHELSEDEIKEYNETLDVSGTGIMGYIEIPKIELTLPLYHGTDPAVLQIAAGHIMGSSLPVGGDGTHCVISGHRGLPSSKLFTNLDELVEGDIFIFNVLGEKLYYKIDSVDIVEPHELDSLKIVPGKDYFTLVTCTPYGINSHRMLLRGARLPNYLAEEEIESNEIMLPEAKEYNEFKSILLIAGYTLLVYIVIEILKSILIRIRGRK